MQGLGPLGIRLGSMIIIKVVIIAIIARVLIINIILSPPPCAQLKSHFGRGGFSEAGISVKKSRGGGGPSARPVSSLRTMHTSM